MTVSLANKLHAECGYLLHEAGVERVVPSPDPVEAAIVKRIGAATATQENLTLLRIGKSIDKMVPTSAGSVTNTVAEVGRHLATHGEIVAPLASEEVLVGSWDYYIAAKEGIAVEFGQNARFVAADQLAVQRINQHTSMFIGNHYQDSVTRKADKLIRNTVARDAGTLSRRQIAADLKRGFPELVTRKGYWEVVASQVVVSARSYSSVRFFEDARIEQYEFVAVQDERTSQQCKYMDGTILSVRRTIENFGRYDTASTIDEVKEVAPWPTQRIHRLDDPTDPSIITGGKGFDLFLGGAKLPPVGTLSGEDLQARGLNAPPLHALCRSFVVAVL